MSLNRTPTRGRKRRVFVFAFVIVGAIASTVFGGEPIELRIMSFNVRFSKAGVSEKASENNWNDPKFPRRERVVRVIRENAPDLFGVQEARELQVEDLNKALPEYGFYGVGRDDGKTAGEFSGIFFRKSRFTRRGAGSFWLSATPEKPGTSFALVVDGCPRIASWVLLRDNKSLRQDFVFLNMHWDHISAEARQQSAALVRKRLVRIARGLPAIVTGDFNSTEDTDAYRTLIGVQNGGPRLADSYRELHPKRSPNEASFDGWKGTRKGSRIDFILHTNEFAPVAAEIVRTSYDGHWPSDHYPVTATLKFKLKTNASNNLN